MAFIEVGLYVVGITVANIAVVELYRRTKPQIKKFLTSHIFNSARSVKD